MEREREVEGGEGERGRGWRGEREVEDGDRGRER